MKRKKEKKKIIKILDDEGEEIGELRVEQKVQCKGMFHWFRWGEIKIYKDEEEMLEYPKIDDGKMWLTMFLLGEDVEKLLEELQE